MTGDLQRPEPSAIVVMGVAGAGKTTVGELLAKQLGWRFVEADDHHSPESRAKLSAGTPLTDTDRLSWLRALNAILRDAVAAGTRVVVACSALAARYRNTLTAGVDRVAFVYLRITPETARDRVARRRHFFNPALVASQFHTLEEPRDALVVDGTRPPLEIVAEVRRRLYGHESAPQ